VDLDEHFLEHVVSRRAIDAAANEVSVDRCTKCGDELGECVLISLAVPREQTPFVEQDDALRLIGALDRRGYAQGLSWVSSFSAPEKS
jgi:hypothetical protein